MNKLNKSGFTIIELMIATVVFSVIMLVIAGALIQIGRLYSKGMTTAKTQEVARSVTNDIAQAIQFNKGVVKGTEGNGENLIDTFCIVNKHYTYALGRQLVGTNHGLVVDNKLTPCGSEPAQDMTKADVLGTELLGDKMRLTKMTVLETSPGSNVYKIEVGVIYGDDDLLCDDNNVQTCSSGEAVALDDAIKNGSLRCKNIRSGSQFCARSELKTTVERRLPE